MRAVIFLSNSTYVHVSTCLGIVLEQILAEPHFLAEGG